MVASLRCQSRIVPYTDRTIQQFVSLSSARTSPYAPVPQNELPLQQNSVAGIEKETQLQIALSSPLGQFVRPTFRWCLHYVQNRPPLRPNSVFDVESSCVSSLSAIRLCYPGVHSVYYYRNRYRCRCRCYQNVCSLLPSHPLYDGVYVCQATVVPPQ